MKESRALLPSLGAFRTPALASFTATLFVIAAAAYVTFDPQGYLEAFFRFIFGNMGGGALPAVGHLYQRILAGVVVTSTIGAFGSVLAATPGGDSLFTDALKKFSGVAWVLIGVCVVLAAYCDIKGFAVCLVGLLIVFGIASILFPELYDDKSFDALVATGPFFLILVVFGLGWFLTFGEDAAQSFGFNLRNIVWLAALLAIQGFKTWANARRLS